MTNQTEDLTIPAVDARQGADEVMSPIVVTAATGKTGRRVNAMLSELRLPTLPVSRSSEVPFTWEDESTWPTVLAGAGACYLAYAPDLALPDAAAAVAGVAAEAVRQGVNRIVLLSGRGEPGALVAERAVQEIAPSATVVRCSFFAQNFSEGAFADEVRTGQLSLPVDGVGEPFVDADDVAAVAVAALTEPGHEGQIYEVTGPELLTFAGASEAIAAGASIPVAFSPVPLEAWISTLAAEGVPPEMVDLLTHLFTEVLDGRNDWVGDGVVRALGRPPRSFAAYVEEAAAAGAWTSSAVDEDESDGSPAAAARPVDRGNVA